MFEFEIKDNNAILIRYNGHYHDIVVPKFIDGNIPVTAIGEEAFFASKVERILLPESIAHIGDRAFLEVVSSGSVAIPTKRISKMASHAFGCLGSA